MVSAKDTDAWTQQCGLLRFPDVGTKPNKWKSNTDTQMLQDIQITYLI